LKALPKNVARRGYGTYAESEHLRNLMRLPKTGRFRPPSEAGQAYTRLRRCPHDACRAVVYVVMQSGKLADSYPPERIDFDPTGIPGPVLAALEEALTCHAARCFTAAAIMVRKTLELLCDDQKATGGNLQERLKALRAKIVLPNELMDGLDELRLLGNDVAHLQSKAYEKVGEDEVEVGIELAKEVLKGVYQYSHLIGRLRSLKKTQ
jgi:hypothetical protein